MHPTVSRQIAVHSRRCWCRLLKHVLAEAVQQQAARKMRAAVTGNMQDLGRGPGSALLQSFAYPGDGKLGQPKSLPMAIASQAASEGSKGREESAQTQAGEEPGTHLEQEEYPGEVKQADHARDDDGGQRVERHVAEHWREA